MQHHPAAGHPFPTADAAGLAFPDRFVLWSVRKWVLGHKSEPRALAMLEEAYARTVSRDGMGLLDALMAALTAGASRRIAVHAPCCGPVSGDEMALLGTLALAQSHAALDLAAPLEAFLTPAGARRAAAPARALAEALAASGFRLSGIRSACPVSDPDAWTAATADATIH
ncbi:MAG: hypothetical protein GC201_03860 [Alphaproteobacteria bacterium]|nr:hypothetical protein [Alphaproteobacteria bacterium]